MHTRAGSKFVTVITLLAALLMAYAMREPLKETLEMYKEIM